MTLPYDVTVKDEGTHLVLTAYTPVARSVLLAAGSLTVPFSGRADPSSESPDRFGAASLGDGLADLLRDLIVADDLGRVTNLEDWT